MHIQYFEAQCQKEAIYVIKMKIFDGTMKGPL